MLAGGQYADVTIRWLLPYTEIQIARPDRPVAVNGQPGELVSLIPMGGGAAGVTTAGLRWQLRDEELPAGVTRGISNELVAATAGVTVSTGVILVVHERAPL